MRKHSITIGMILSFMLFITGCNSSHSYPRNTNSGKVEKITLAEMDAMFAKKQTFTVMLTQTMCGYCLDFHELLNEYQKDHHLIMYEVVLDEETSTREENLAIIEKHIHDFSTTPGIFTIEKGEEKAHLRGNEQGITEEMLDNWVQENQLDEKT